MSRVLDLDQKESEWLNEIEKHESRIQEYDSTIAEAQELKQKSIEEIDKLNRWMRTAREMYGLETSDIVQEESKTSGSSPETRAESIPQRYEELRVLPV